MRTLLFITAFFLPAIVFAQEFKPLLNPTIACSYGSPDNPIDWDTNMTKLVHYFFIVEEMPKPKMVVNDIESLLQANIHFTAKELAEQGKIAIQCLVNCEGKAGDFQIISCKSEIANISSHILDVFKKNVTDWQAGIQRGKKVDVLVKIEINVDKGRIEVIRT